MVRKTILFSGRFDRPHWDHLETITDLGKEFQKVVIVVLDFLGQMYPVQYRAQRLRRMLKKCKGNYEVVVNSTHFGTITREELSLFKFDVYGSGNLGVLKHIESLGVSVYYVSRSGDQSATDERKYQMIKEIMYENK